ncbi:MAG TPA: DUF1990 domain-containing protein [Mycobacteriales bacterium]|jgi:uncharacterized protein (UPF0548 family)|nr:DUF1990 domain-containing protein [Mycobacteriales bacterium]
MRLVGRKALGRILAEYDSSDFTYEPVGATAGNLPAGYAHVRRRTLLGAGEVTFEKAVTALTQWEMHRRSGLSVVANGPAETGRTVVLGLGVGVALVIPCRVVYVIEEPRRHGFAYGTLPDHPEQGEEAFVVTQDDAGSVWFDITAYSRPGAALVRRAGPIARAVQGVATRRYELSLLALTA